MPYAFTGIEKEKSRVIILTRLLLTSIYFLFAAGLIVLARMLFYRWILIDAHPGVTGPIPVEYHIKLLTLPEIFFVLGFSVFVAMFHWNISTRDLTPRILKMLRAKPLDTANFAHQQFRNILGELSAATGGRAFEGYVIPSSSINAFSIQDFDHLPVIGVTEGLLSRLKRPQIEAVLAHEAAHLLKGDSLDNTLVISLFNLPMEVLKDMADDTDYSVLYAARLISLQSRFLVALFWIMFFLTRTAGQLLNLCMSRQREFRADAIAVRLTRDPLSLAEGLYLASYHWRGAGTPGGGLSPLFIVRPCYNSFKEGEGVLSNLFSTHPPVEQRLSILLDMAHTDFDLFEGKLIGSYKKILDRLRAGKHEEERWLVRKDRQWLGPFGNKDIGALGWIEPGTLVKRIGGVSILSAGTDEELKKIFETRKYKVRKEIYCPQCYVALQPIFYEGFVLLKCRSCDGVLVEDKNADGILKRREMKFGGDIARMARIIKEENIVTKKRGERELYTRYELTCPVCREYHNKMTRRFHSDQYHVEIDQCAACQRIWFDKNELEILQFLFEEAHPAV